MVQWFNRADTFRKKKFYRRIYSSIKILQNTGRNICDFGLGNGFLDGIPKIQAKEKNNIN